MQIPEIDVQRLNEWRQDERPHVLLDVREQDEFDRVRISGGLLAPLSAIATQGPAALPSTLKKSDTIVVYCHHGGRSAQVTGWLQSQGYDTVHNLAGGIDAWSLQIDPTLPRY